MAYSPKHQTPINRTLLTILKVCYIILTVLSAIIVALFIIFKVTVQPPDVGDEVVDVIIPVEQPDSNGPLDPDDPKVTATPQVIQMTRKENFHTFLLMGTDDGNGNADTIMVGSYDVKNNKINVLSIPRDTLVDVSRTIKKINGAYGMGGIAQVMDELTPILGFRPDHYIMVDIQAFVDVVNILGGVSYNVPEDMYHNDGAGFIIDLKAGPQVLDGNKALQLVRYRGYADKSSDLGRMRTQQQFLKEIAKQVLSWSNVAKVNEFAEVLSKYFETDLSVTELAWFGTAALRLDFSNDITFATLPGDGSVTYRGIPYYYELYPEECYELVNVMLNPYTTDLPPELIRVFQVD